MSIDPSSGSGGPTAPSEPAGPTGATGSTGATGATAPVDTMAESGNPSAPQLFSVSSSATPWLDPPTGPMTLIQYSNLVGIMRINLTSQNAYSNELGFTVTSDMWANAISLAQSIRDYYENVAKVHTNLGILSTTQQTQSSTTQPSIDAYNSANDFGADQAATDTMNQAITDFNDGSITEAEFNSAVSVYNAYASAHNMQAYVTSYNAAADSYNAQVVAFNATAEATNLLNEQTGLPPIPLETPLPSGTLPTATTSPPATIPIALIPDPPSVIPNVDPTVEQGSFNDLLDNSGFEDYVDDLMEALGITNDKLFTAEAFRDLNVFTHKNLLDVQNPPYETESYIQDEDKGSTPSSTGGGVASGNGYASLALGMSANGLPRVLGTNLFSAAMKDTGVPLYLSDIMALSNAAIGQTAGLVSAAPGVLAIGDVGLKGLSGAIPSVKMMVALGFANVIRGLITGQQLSGVVGNLLSTNGVSDADMVKLTKTLTAGFQLSLIQQAILQVANALGLPGSVAQIIGNMSGIPNLDSVVGSAANANINDILANEHQIGFLKDALTAQLGASQPTLDGLKASQIINDVIDRAIAQGPYDSPNAFSEVVKNELIKEGLTEDAAISSSLQASAYLDDELSSDYLDQSITNQGIGQSILKADLVTQDAIKAAVQNSDLLSEAQTVRDVRDGLIKQLTLQGLTFADALKKANELAEAITGVKLAQEFSAQVLDQSTLQKSLQEGLARVGGNPGLAGSITQLLAESRINSVAEARQRIFDELTAAGLTYAEAHSVTGSAIIARQDQDAFLRLGATSVLSAGEVSERIQAEAYALLRNSLDNPTAMSVAQQLALAVVGPPTNQDIAYDDVKRPVSLLNLANDQIAVLRETDDTQTLDAMKEIFREVMRPTDNLFYIVNWQNTPGTELINAMSLMNAGHGKHPSNALQSIDIPA